jgi:hypothetical protein
MPSLVQTWALPVAFLATVNISATWYNVVSKEVPDPYLVSARKARSRRYRTHYNALG